MGKVWGCVYIMQFPLYANAMFRQYLTYSQTTVWQTIASPLYKLIFKYYCVELNLELSFDVYFRWYCEITVGCPVIMVQWSERWQLVAFISSPSCHIANMSLLIFNGLYTCTHLATMHVLNILKNVKTNGFVYQSCVGWCLQRYQIAAKLYTPLKKIV